MDSGNLSADFFRMPKLLPFLDEYAILIMPHNEIELQSYISA